MNDLLTVAMVAMTTAWLTNIASQSRLLEWPRGSLQLWFENRWLDKHVGDHAERRREWMDLDEWQSKPAYFLSCTWCTGTWVAIPVTLVSDMTMGLSMPLLVYGASAFIAGRYGS